MRGKKHFLSGVKKVFYCNSIGGGGIYIKEGPKINHLVNVGSIYVVSVQDYCLENCSHLFPWASSQLARENC